MEDEKHWELHPGFHPNTKRLMNIADEAFRLGYCGDFCRKVAEKAGELGNLYPSNNAISIALDLLEELKPTEETDEDRHGPNPWGWMGDFWRG